MLNKYLTCPKCGSPRIREKECHDTFTFGEGLELWFVGTCMDCGKKVRWKAMCKLVEYIIKED